MPSDDNMRTRAPMDTRSLLLAIMRLAADDHANGVPEYHRCNTGRRILERIGYSARRKGYVPGARQAYTAARLFILLEGLDR